MLWIKPETARPEALPSRPEPIRIHTTMLNLIAVTIET